MAEIVALTNAITLDWLSEIATYSAQGIGRKEAGEMVTATISQHISSPDNIRKTRTILQKVWFDATPLLLKQACELYRSVTSDEKMALHWSLFMDQYTIFDDMCDVMGHLYAFRDVITLQQIKERIYGKWGERNILRTSLTKIMRTFKELGAVTVGKQNGYYVLQKHTISDPHVAGILLYATLHSTEKRYMTWANFVSHPAMFPFNFVGMDESDMAALDFISLERLDNQTVLSVVE